MKKTQTTRLNEIPLLAKQVAKELRGGEILALIGSLGAGKTTFTQALGKALKIRHKITSPTFTLLNLFPAHLLKGTKVTLYHLDLYRTKNFKEVKALGITEFWGKKETITVIEWANKIKRYLPKKTKYIFFNNAKI